MKHYGGPQIRKLNGISIPLPIDDSNQEKSPMTSNFNCTMEESPMTSNSNCIMEKSPKRSHQWFNTHNQLAKTKSKIEQIEPKTTSENDKIKPNKRL